MTGLLLLTSCQSNYDYYNDYQERKDVSVDDTNVLDPIVDVSNINLNRDCVVKGDHLTAGKFYFTDIGWDTGKFRCTFNSSYSGIITDLSCTFTLYRNNIISGYVVWSQGVTDLAYQHLVVADSEDFDTVQLSSIDYKISDCTIDYYDNIKQTGLSIKKTGRGVYHYQHHLFSDYHRLILINDKMQVIYNDMLDHSCTIVVDDIINRIGVVKDE